MSFFSSPVFEAIGLWGGIALAVLGIWLTIRSKEHARPKCFYVSELRVRASADPHPDLLVSYRGAPVPRVTATYVWLWNAGRKPIRKTDIPENQPLRLRLTDDGQPVFILDAALVRASRPAIEARVHPVDDRTLELGFGFLDRNDGLLVELIHAGSARTEAVIEGVVLGVPAGVKADGLLPPPAYDRGGRLPNVRVYEKRPRPKLMNGHLLYGLCILLLFVVVDVGVRKTANSKLERAEMRLAPHVRVGHLRSATDAIADLIRDRPSSGAVLLFATWIVPGLFMLTVISRPYRNRRSVPVPVGLLVDPVAAIPEPKKTE